jgi:hypothetical protein
MNWLRPWASILLCAMAVSSQCQTFPDPTNDEATSACLTLEHLLVAARQRNDAQDAAVLTQAYAIVRRYVTAESSLSKADQYEEAFLKFHPDLGDAKPAPVVVWDKAFDGLTSDRQHQAGALVYGNNGTVENLHFKENAGALVQLLKNNGAVAAEPLGQ